MEEEKVMQRSKINESPWIKESIRSLRNKLIADDQNNIVLCFASLYPHEGVSTIVRLLAANLSDIEKNVIVVSTDLKSKADEIESAVFTLKDYLSGNCSLENIVINVDGHFKLIVGSDSDKDYSDLLHLDLLAKMISKLKNDYDLVLIDAPSFTTASETTILSRLADSLVLVVMENRVSIDDLMEFSKKIQKQNITIKGIVLNKVSETDNLEINLI
jgi:Mrp family chromosome partitioning ATPase